jgi:putative sterol carrier protein
MDRDAAERLLAEKKIHVIISCSDDTFRSLVSGGISAESAYMRGSMRVQGAMGVALRVKSLLAFAAGAK